MDNTSEARRKKIMRRKRAMLKRTHRRINVTFIIVFVLLLVLGVRIFMINYTHGEEYSQADINPASVNVASNSNSYQSAK